MCFEIYLAPLVTLLNVNTNRGRTLVLVKFAQNNTPPQPSFTIYNDSDSRKLRNTPHEESEEN